VVVEIGAGAVGTARELLEVLGANTVVVEELHADVANLFDQEAEPAPEPDPAAAPGAPPGS
jgi:spermidine synthase